MRGTILRTHSVFSRNIRFFYMQERHVDKQWLMVVRAVKNCSGRKQSDGF